MPADKTLIFTSAPAERRYFGPPRGDLCDAIHYLKQLVHVTSRSKSYKGVDVAVDINGESIGEEVCIILRYISRLLLMENPIGIWNLHKLEEKIIDFLREVGFKEYISFFDWFFKCKVGDHSMLLTLYRAFASASDIAARTFMSELKDPRSEVLGQFLPVGCSGADINHKKMVVFNLTKDRFFDSLGIDVNFYLQGTQLIVVQPLLYGMFTTFFTKIKNLNMPNDIGSK